MDQQPLSRRMFLASASVATALAAVPPAAAQAASPPPAAPLILAPLGYAFDALEPTIDAKTMETHYGKHHAAYITNFNALAREHGVQAEAPVEKLLADWQQLPEAARVGMKNNLGGHANHTMFWQIMAPGGAKEPGGELKAAIERDFGGFERMKGEFNTLGARIFGSGWVFVTVDAGGKLALTTRSNQDSPLMEGKRVLFGNDVWEHAYYFKYHNRRAEYLANWWNVANWSKIGERFGQAKAGTLKI